jgi:predicted esterase YcpF (UPF0227 family)
MTAGGTGESRSPAILFLNGFTSSPEQKQSVKAHSFIQAIRQGAVVLRQEVSPVNNVTGECFALAKLSFFV